MMTSAASFSQGWHDAALGVAALTAREVASRYPTADVDACLNGVDDGLRGDRWRLDYNVEKGDRTMPKPQHTSELDSLSPESREITLILASMRPVCNATRRTRHLIAAAPALYQALAGVVNVYCDARGWRCASCNAEIAPEGYCGCKPPHDHAAKAVHDAYGRLCAARAALALVDGA